MKIKDALQTSSKHWFEQALDIVQLEDERKEKSRQIASNIDHFRPSMLHQCPRAIWYARKGYEASETKVQGLRRMAMGTLLHEFIERLSRKTDYFSSAEEDVFLDEDGTRILGHYDMIVKNPVGEYELIEIKSYGEPKPNSRYKLVLPKEEHILQWNWYSYLTSVTEGLPDVAEGFIFYINKNDQSYKIYNQKRDWVIVDQMLEKVESIQRYLDEDVIYPYQPDENHNWCNFRGQCERDYYLRGE